MTALLLIFSPAVLIGGVAGAVRLYRCCAFGAGLLVLSYVLGAIAVAPIGFEAAGFHLYLEDLTGMGLASAAAMRLWFEPRFRQQTKGWRGFTAATALAFAMGASAYGLKAAGVEYRNFFYVCAAVLYCASFALDGLQLKNLANIWLAGATVLLALALFRWSADLAHLGITSQWAAVGGGQRWRVLNASQTFFLAQAFLIAVYFRRKPLAVVLAVAVVLLQHRSVWVALLCAGMAICWREGMLRKFITTATLAALLGGLVYFAAPHLFNRDSSLTDSLAESVEEPFDADHSTFSWRVGLWQAYLLEYLNAPDLQKVVGMGFGNQSSYAVDFSESVDSAHNYYIFMLNRTGVLGLVALVGAYVSLLRRLRTRTGRWNYTGLFFGLIFSQVVYYTVYSPSPDQGLLIGAVLGMVGVAASNPAARPAQEVQHVAAAA